MRQGPHPLRFFVLILPYAAAFGYVSVALNWIAVNRYGVSVEVFAGVLAAAFQVHGFKLLLAPLVDATLTKRAWYLIALALTVLGVLISGVLQLGPKTMGLFTLVVMASQVGLALMGFACENFLGALPDAEKGSAAGYYQAGNFFGMGVGGGLALKLATSLPSPWMAGAILAALMVPCAIALVGLPEPERHATSLTQSMRELLTSLREVVLLKSGSRWVPSLLGISVLVIAVSPVGASAVGNVITGAAGDWRATADDVALVQGALGGILGAIGAFAGGWLADRLDRRANYALAGALIALANVAWSFMPFTREVFIGMNLLTGIFGGMAYAAFSALVLESIGRGALATKYNIFAGLANFAISYMTRIDGAAYDRVKAAGMLRVDAACTFAGIAVVLLTIWTLRRLAPRFAAPSAEPAT